MTTKKKNRQKGGCGGCFSFFIAALVGLGIAMTYGLIPVDLVPEIALGPFGYLDDLALILGGAYLTYRKLNAPTN